jgi:hypothetical protein
VCVAGLLRHIWPLHGPGQDLALGLVAAAAIMWGLAMLALTRGDATEGVTRGSRPFFLLTVATVTLAAVGLVLAFFAPA